MPAQSFNKQILAALAGDLVERPLYAAYDAFLDHPGVDWSKLFDLGFGAIRHVEVIEPHYPNAEIKKSIEETDTTVKTEITWETSKGILREAFLKEKNNPLLPWRTEHFIKSEADYALMTHALEGATYTIGAERPLFPFPPGLTVSPEQCFTMLSMDRTPFQKVQIDYAGLERFPLDFMDECDELIELLELMNAQFLEKFKLAASYAPIRDIKLWENLSAEVFGPRVYREQLVPVYRELQSILSGTDKRLHVHYDGQMGMITEDIKALGFDGIDSFTGEPEGDLTVAEGRAAMGDIFLWIHPSLSWFSKSREAWDAYMQRCIAETGGRRYAFVLSEDVPLHAEERIAAFLKNLLGKDGFPPR